MKVTVVMASGKELVFECDDVTVGRSSINPGLAHIKFANVRGQNFLHIALEHVDAVLYEKGPEE